jgi:hypothetical protein
MSTWTVWNGKLLRSVYHYHQCSSNLVVVRERFYAVHESLSALCVKWWSTKPIEKLGYASGQCVHRGHNQSHGFVSLQKQTTSSRNKKEVFESHHMWFENEVQVARRGLVSFSHHLLEFDVRSCSSLVNFYLPFRVFSITEMEDATLIDDTQSLAAFLQSMLDGFD